MGIVCACLPTLPALFNWRSIRDSRRPSRFESNNFDLARYPSLTLDERRQGYRANKPKAPNMAPYEKVRDKNAIYPRVAVESV